MQVMGAWKFVRSLPAALSFFLFSLFLSPPIPRAAPYYLRLLSNTKNQIKYAKLRFEDFGELGNCRGVVETFFLLRSPT